MNVDDKELEQIVFNEIISDFASLVKEYGASAVAASIQANFPEIADQVYQRLGMPLVKRAALLKP